MEPKKTTQYFTSFAATLGALALGAVIGYSSPTGPLFLSGQGTLTLTEAQNNWVSSIITVGACIGCPVGGFAMRTFGRRLSMIYSVAPYVIGWVLIIAAQSFSMLLIGRLVCGVCMGISSVIVPTFIGEYASANIRGALTACFQLMVTLGILLAYAMGPAFDSFRLIAVICTIPAVLHGILSVFCKESPTYLLIKGRNKEAKEALQFYRGSDYDVTKELELIKAAVDETRQNRTSFTDLGKPYLLKPLMIAIALHFFQQASGVNAALFNLSLIFEEAGTNFDSNISAIIIGSVLVVSTAVSTGLVDKLGRKFLLIISSAFMTISLVPLGVYFYLKDSANGNEQELQELSDTIGWIPLVSLIVFIAGLSIGYGPIPWIMMGEMFTSDSREMASSIATMSNWATAFIVTITFGPLKSAIGSHGAYWMFSVICAINFLFCVFIVPETKGKRIEEIADLFGSPSRKPQHQRQDQI